MAGSAGEGGLEEIIEPTLKSDYLGIDTWAVVSVLLPMEQFHREGGKVQVCLYMSTPTKSSGNTEQEFNTCLTCRLLPHAPHPPP